MICPLYLMTSFCLIFFFSSSLFFLRPDHLSCHVKHVHSSERPFKCQVTVWPQDHAHWSSFSPMLLSFFRRIDFWVRKGCQIHSHIDCINMLIEVGIFVYFVRPAFPFRVGGGGVYFCSNALGPFIPLMETSISANQYIALPSECLYPTMKPFFFFYLDGRSLFQEDPAHIHLKRVLKSEIVCCSLYTLQISTRLNSCRRFWSNVSKFALHLHQRSTSWRNFFPQNGVYT